MKYVVVVVCLMIGLFCSSVYAAIPLITDDTGTQGKGKFQLELAGEYGHDKEESVTNKNSDFSAALTYGVADSLDIVLSIPYQIWHAEENGLQDKRAMASLISRLKQSGGSTRKRD